MEILHVLMAQQLRAGGKIGCSTKIIILGVQHIRSRTGFASTQVLTLK